MKVNNVMSENYSNIDFFILSPKEEAAMDVLWNTDSALSAAEIAANIPDRTWPATSIQSILRNLEKKQAIMVVEITKLGKSYGRLFRPTLSANEYAAMQFKHYYQKNSQNSSAMLASLLGNIHDDKKDIVDTLHALLKKYRN